MDIVWRNITVTFQNGISKKFIFSFRQVMRGDKERRVMGEIKAKKMKYISRVQVGRIMKGVCILQGPSSSSKRVKVSNSFILDEPLLAYEYLLLSSSLHWTVLVEFQPYSTLRAFASAVCLQPKTFFKFHGMRPTNIGRWDCSVRTGECPHNIRIDHDSMQFLKYGELDSQFPFGGVMRLAFPVIVKHL